MTKDFKFTVRAKRSIGQEIETTFKDKTFTLTILGDVDSSLLGLLIDLDLLVVIIFPTLAVQATTNVPNGVLLYTLESGTLPGLTLKSLQVLYKEKLTVLEVQVI